MKTIESHPSKRQEEGSGCLHMLNGIPYSILNHGDTLPLSTNNFREIAKDISKLSHPVVAIDGYLADGENPTISRSNSNFPLIEAVSQTQGTLLATDFLSIKSAKDFTDDQADKGKKLAAVTGAATLIMGGKLLFDSRGSRGTPINRRTALKGTGISLAAGAIAAISFRAATNLGRETRLSYLEQCEPNAFFDAQDAASFSPNYMDLVARTAFSSIKIKNLPPSELTTRGIPAIAPKRLVFGRDHFTPLALAASNEMLLDPVKAVDFIVVENALLGILQGYDETTVKNYLSTLQLNLSASVFYHPVETEEGFKWDPIYNPHTGVGYYIDPILFPPAARTQDANTLKAYADALSGVYYNSASKMAKTLQ